MPAALGGSGLGGRLGSWRAVALGLASACELECVAGGGRGAAAGRGGRRAGRRTCGSDRCARGQLSDRRLQRALADSTGPFGRTRAFAGLTTQFEVHPASGLHRAGPRLAACPYRAPKAPLLRLPLSPRRKPVSTSHCELRQADWRRGLPFPRANLRGYYGCAVLENGVGSSLGWPGLTPSLPRGRAGNPAAGVEPRFRPPIFPRLRERSRGNGSTISAPTLAFPKSHALAFAEPPRPGKEERRPSQDVRRA
jgi:hypothetical protein